MKENKIIKLFALLLLAAMLLGSCTSVTDGTDTTAAEGTTGTMPETWTAHSFAMTVVSVGYGDCIIIQIDKKNYMIDTGQKSASNKVLAALNILGIKKLDGLFLTHTHSDHIGGVPAVCENINVKCLYSASISMNEKNGTNKITALGQTYSLPHTRLHAGNTVQVTTDVYFTVLGPIEENTDDDNDNSLVLRLYINGVSILLTGDMQFAEETTVIATGESLDADILKVGNHGNKDATSKAFVDLAAPSVSLISTNTAENASSNSQRVRDTLSDSTIYVTENYDYGIYVTVGVDSKITVAALEGEKSDLKLSVDSIDAENEIITLRNNADTAADISGCIIYSDKGGEAYVFPDGAAISAGGTVSVVTRDMASGGEEYVWNADSVWHDTKEDTAIVYDRCGNELTRSAS